jgi:hypothetical protein
MEVIYYQLIIIVTVGLTYLIGGRKKALYVSIFWTAWTVVLLLYPPLVVTQLGFTWGTFALCAFMAGNRQEINELKAALSTYPASMQNRVEDHARGCTIDKIIGKAHKRELSSAAKEASRELVILSGWLTSSVVNDLFVRTLEDAMSRGVKIYIGYGWEDWNGSHSESASSADAIFRLNALKKKNPNAIHIAKFANHQKILIKDNDYIICGSNNWLSNNAFRNSEISMKIYSPSLASSESERFKREVEQGESGNG